MPYLLFIPGGVFLLCGLAQFAFIKRIRAALAERHPDVWREMSVKAWFIDSAVATFARRGAKSLNDPDLNSSIDGLRVVYGVAIAAWLLMMAMLVAGVALPAKWVRSRPALDGPRASQASAREVRVVRGFQNEREPTL